MGGISSKAIGGGSSAVAASAHAGCARFRQTDPLITGRSRRKLATDVGFADDSGKIPEARWLRAATFERLVRDDKFASEVATTTVGRLGLERPESVVVRSGHNSPVDTADVLLAAHERAVAHGAATMIYQMGLPFVGFEDDEGATPVLPDFAVVMRKSKAAVGGDADGSWLIMGDAKDYERVRSKIDDGRLLKGFLQVALGAESAAAWSKLPAGMDVHHHGVLAVPRNAFLQPEALVEDITDHRFEVRMRVAERRVEAEGLPVVVEDDIVDFVAHLEATFDPGQFATCTMFSYCRDELRRSAQPTDLLIELGVAADVRPHAAGLVDGETELGPIARSLEAMIVASRDGVAQRTGQRRVDPVGRPGTINVVLAKSDSAAQADERAVRFAFEDAKKALGPDIANAYVDHLTVGDDSDEALRDALVRKAALSHVPEVREAVDQKSDQVAEDFFDEHADAIEALPDDRRQEYRDINALAATPQVDRLGRPRTRTEDYVETDEDGQTTRAELVKMHLMSDENGDAPITKLNDWEGEVVKHEIGRDGAIGWYRNPPRQTADSLGIAYRDETTGNWRSMHPDFVFFHDVDGEVKASVVDPHGHHLEDSLVKLQALARFAEEHGDAFHRIEALSKVGHVMKVLNMKDEGVRGGLRVGGQSVDWFYNSQFATNYYAESTKGT